MFGKISRHQVERAFKVAKGHLGSFYTGAKNVFSTVDNGFKIAKTVYGALAPYINEFAGGNAIHDQAMKTFKNYDEIKNKVLEKHNIAENAINDVRRGIREKHKLMY